MRGFPTNCIPYTPDQLVQIGQSLMRTRLPPVLVDDKRRVLAGWGQIEFSRRVFSPQGRNIWVVRYSEMTPTEVRIYEGWMREIALRERWDSQLLALEPQGLRIFKALKRDRK
jgi:hypothetical protein